MKEKVERLDAIAAPDRIDIPEPLGGDERRARALALEHRIDRDGRTVKHFGQACAIDFRQIDCIGDPLRRIGRNGGGLGRDDPAVDAADEIGEGSPDIDAHKVHKLSRRFMALSLSSA